MTIDVHINSNQPIGIFDSGIGGLSVLKHIKQLMPYEDLVYIADSGYAPYGCKEPAFIEQRSQIMTETLLKHGVKAIVIACNTATASIIERFRQQYGVPFIGVEPGIKPAIEITKSGHIGVMATTGTLSSERYKNLSQRLIRNVTLHNQPCPGLADQVEAGNLEAICLLQNYLDILTQKQVDTIVLGCTHYSFLIAQIEKLTGASMNIVETSLAIAQQVQRVLNQYDLQRAIQSGNTYFMTSGSVTESQIIINKLLGYETNVYKV